MRLQAYYRDNSIEIMLFLKEQQDEELHQEIDACHGQVTYLDHSKRGVVEQRSCSKLGCRREEEGELSDGRGRGVRAVDRVACVVCSQSEHKLVRCEHKTCLKRAGKSDIPEPKRARIESGASCFALVALVGPMTVRHYKYQAA